MYEQSGSVSRSSNEVAVELSPSLDDAIHQTLGAAHRLEIMLEELLGQLLGVATSFDDSPDVPTMRDRAVESCRSVLRSQESVDRIRGLLFG